MRFRLDLLLLLALVICTWSANIIAKRQREKATRTLALLESTAGIPFITDRDQAELIAMTTKANDKLDWYVWIPDGQRYYLCAATHGLTNTVLVDYEQFEFKPGRHHVIIDRYFNENLTYRIRIDNVEWMITNPLPEMDPSKFEGTKPTLPWSFTIKNRVKLDAAPVTVFRTIGKATLKADEAYNSAKHALGLQLWIKKYAD
jgi:hypothetical protein